MAAMSERHIEELERRRDELRNQLARIRDMRQGSLVGRYRQCGKPSCHCAHEKESAHGPSWSLTRAVGGKTITRIIPADAVEQTREQIAEYHKFRELTRELIEINERLCDVRLRTETERSEGVKKGASKRSSRRLKKPCSWAVVASSCKAACTLIFLLSGMRTCLEN